MINRAGAVLLRQKERMEMTNESITKIIEMASKEPVCSVTNYWIGTTYFQRAYIDDKEYTLVKDEMFGDCLYEGVAYFDGEKDTYSTVTRVKEGRREDGLRINGCPPRFASLIAKNIKSSTDFFKTC